MLKIYFENKPLFITERKNEELEPYLGDPRVPITDTITDDALSSIVAKMQDRETKAGIILHNISAAYNAVKHRFKLIQASGGLVHSNHKNVLLIFRRKKWDLPKGKLDEGEDLVECALREVKEETGLSYVEYEKPLCISYHTYYEDKDHILKESHWHLLKGKDSEVLTPQTDEDIEKCEWVTIEKLGPYMENMPASIVDVLESGIKILKEN